MRLDRVGRHKDWHAGQKDGLSFGQRSADRMRNAMGSWRFVIGFVVGMFVWAFAAKAFDPYPYTFLNLILSMLAGLQGAILLIAAKRQDEVSAALAQHDFDTNVAAKEEIEDMMKKLDRLETDKLDAIMRHLDVKDAPPKQKGYDREDLKARLINNRSRNKSGSGTVYWDSVMDVVEKELGLYPRV